MDFKWFSVINRNSFKIQSIDFFSDEQIFTSKSSIYARHFDFTEIDLVFVRGIHPDLLYIFNKVNKLSI